MMTRLKREPRQSRQYGSLVHALHAVGSLTRRIVNPRGEGFSIGAQALAHAIHNDP
jgi:hypothetical protein